jgi:hypothetical protein
MTKMNSKKTVVSTMKKSKPSTTVFPVATETAPVVEQTINTSVETEKENIMKNETTVTTTETTNAPAPLPAKRKGGNTKAKREAKAKELAEIRARLVSEFTSKFKAGEIPPGEFAQAMLDMEQKVTEEYNVIHHPKGTGKGRSDPQDALHTGLSGFMRKYSLTSDQVKVMFAAVIDLPIKAKQQKNRKNNPDASAS